MAGSTSIHMPLDDQAFTADSSVVQPNTPPSNWPQQNQSTPPLNQGLFHISMAEPNVAQQPNPFVQPQNQAQAQYIQFDPSYLPYQNPSMPPPKQDSNNLQNQTAIFLVNAQSSEPSPPIFLPPSIMAQPNPSPPQNLVQHHMLQVDSSNSPLPNHDYFNNQQDQSSNSHVIAQPSEPTPNNLNPSSPCIIVVSQPMSQPSISAPPSTYYTPPSLSTPLLINHGSNPMNTGPSFNDQPNPSPPPPRQCSDHNIILNQQPQEFPPPNTSTPTPPPPPPIPNHQKTETPLPNLLSPVLTQQFHTGPLKKKVNVANKAANLANLLPTGTVLVFQALTPSLANTADGKCQVFNKYFIGIVIAFCAATCFFSSFTDSLEVGEKLYYGFATFRSFWVVNCSPEEKENIKDSELKKLKIQAKDYVHAFGSLFVFLIFAFSSSDVLHCFFPNGGENQYSMVLYLPLVAGVLSSFLFSIFPTERKGFGYGDNIRR